MPDLLRDSLNTFGCKLQAEAQMLACFAPHTVSPENPGSHSQRAHAGEHSGEAVESTVGKQWAAQWANTASRARASVLLFLTRYWAIVVWPARHAAMSAVNPLSSTSPQAAPPVSTNQCMHAM
eukprot:645576-Prorocentrum_minimum.AAC.1